MRLSLRIAARFLLSGKAQTVLILLGISIGVAVQVFLGSLIEGLQKGLIETTIGSSSHITISQKEDEKNFSNWKRTIYEIKSSEANIQNISVSVDNPGFVYYKDKTEPILLRGIVFADADKIYKIGSRLYEGKLPVKDTQIMIGKDLAEKLKLKTGRTLKVSMSNGNASSFEVVGFYDLKVASINKSWMFTTLSAAQNLIGIDNKITSIEMQVQEVFQADSIADMLKQNISNKNLTVDNWKEQNASLLSGLNGQSVSSYMIQVFVLIAVTLGISSVLAISVVQKSKQIGILKAIGIQNRNASLIFVLQGLILGLFGGILGIGFGVGLLKMFATFALNPDGNPVVPVYININFMALSGIIAVTASVIASLIPARLSVRLDPIEVIRNA